MELTFYSYYTVPLFQQRAAAGGGSKLVSFKRVEGGRELVKESGERRVFRIWQIQGRK